MKRHLLTSNIPSQALICLWRFAIFLLSLISTVTRVKKATTTKNNKNQAQPNWTPARHTECIATNSSHHSQKYSEQLFMFRKTVYNADKPMSQSWGLIYWILTKQMIWQNILPFPDDIHPKSKAYFSNSWKSISVLIIKINWFFRHIKPLITESCHFSFLFSKTITFIKLCRSFTKLKQARHVPHPS